MDTDDGVPDIGVGDGARAAEASADEAAATPASEEVPAEPARLGDDDAAEDWWHDGPEPAQGPPH